MDGSGSKGIHGHVILVITRHKHIRPSIAIHIPGINPTHRPLTIMKLDLVVLPLLVTAVVFGTGLGVEGAVATGEEVGFFGAVS